MAIEVWQAERAKGRSARWAFRVVRDGRIVFESSWVSVRYGSREAATWLARLIDALGGPGTFRGCPGHGEPRNQPILWVGSLRDDCSAQVGELILHAEHLSGPARGGLWYCSVQCAGAFLFHTAEFGIEPHSGAAARWLCEVVVCAARAGIDTRHE